MNLKYISNLGKKLAITGIVSMSLIGYACAPSPEVKKIDRVLDYNKLGQVNPGIYNLSVGNFTANEDIEIKFPGYTIGITERDRDLFVNVNGELPICVERDTDYLGLLTPNQSLFFNGNNDSNPNISITLYDAERYNYAVNIFEESGTKNECPK